MLCAEDEQSRTCWMTAFRLLKVLNLYLQISVEMNTHEFVRTWKHALTPPLLSCALTVWDSTVSELQRSTAKEVRPLAFLRACGEDLLFDITFLTSPPPP